MRVDREELVEILKAVEDMHGPHFMNDAIGKAMSVGHLNVRNIRMDLEFGEPVTEIYKPVRTGASK